MINVDEGDGKPRWLRRRLHAHEEKLPVVLAAENMRARFDDAKIKGHPVLERRRRPLVIAGDGGEVVQKLPPLPGEVAARLRALARCVRTHQPVLGMIVVGGLLGAPVLGVVAVNEDGFDGVLHAEASREVAGGTSDRVAERALLFRQIAAAGRADHVPGTLEGNTMQRLASEHMHFYSRTPSHCQVDPSTKRSFVK